MNITIRSLTQADEPFLWETLYHAIFAPPGEPAPPRAIVQLPSVRRYVEGWGQEHDAGFVTLTPEPVGTVWLRLFTAPHKGYGYVADTTSELSIAVLPGHRGRGIGNRLLARMLEAARERYPAVSLSVDVRNPARRLYERFGFRTIRQVSYSLVMVTTYCE